MLIIIILGLIIIPYNTLKYITITTFRIILHEFSPYLSINQKTFTTFIFAKKGP